MATNLSANLLDRWAYTWEHGRQLKTAASGGTTWTYTYNSAGLRTARTNGSVTYNYVYNGSKLTRLTRGSDTLYFAYDASGPMSVTYNGTTYYYVLNLQGDVTAILNSNGAVVVEYTYDAWGKLLGTTGDLASMLGAINPLRYRGYVYDQETELYCLQTRYYNPTIGRFISADVFVSTGQGQLGCNMFAYCGNNPVMRADSEGTDWKTACIIGLTAAVIGIAVLTAIPTGGGSLLLAGAGISASAATTAASATIATGATLAVGAAATGAVQAAQSNSAQDNQRKNDGAIYSVYFLQDARGNIRYVGRVKTANLRSRLRCHELTRGLTEYNVISGLTYEEARGLEEKGMLSCHTLTGQRPGNVIHGISPTNPKRDLYIFDAIGYLDNKASSEILGLFS